jgi:putative hydrolase
VADDDVNPFANLPMFGDLAKALSGQGPLNWEAARQFAALAATGGEAEHNVDPQVRIALGDLSGIADMHIREVTGLEPQPTRFEVTTVTPGAWAQRTLTDYQPLFTELATSLNQRPPGQDQAVVDPSMAMMAGLSQMMAPAMLGMAVGSMVGHLARRAFGQHDLPIPRPGSSELVLVPGTIDAFAAEWELPRDDLRLWVLTQELAANALFSVPHIREAVLASVRRHVGGFRPDPNALMDKLASVEETAEEDADPMAALQRAFGDPEVLLGAVRSPQQEAMQPQLDALLALVVGYVDHVVDAVSTRLLGSPGRIAEAVRRRRIEASPDDAFVEKLLGLRLDRQQVNRGKGFVAGVVERAGNEGLAQLYVGEANLPTPAELDAPGLWLARIDYPGA